MTALVDAIGQRYRFNYNRVGLVTHVRRGTDVMSFTYDAVGNRKTRTDYNGALSDYTYDALNRLKTITYPDTATVSYTYDKLSRLQTATNANGTVNFDYNKMNRLIRATEVFGQVVEYNYDPNGNRTKLNLNDAIVATYKYDPINRLTKILDAAGLAFDFTYDSTNRLTSRKAPNGVTATYQYDGVDRLTRITDEKGANTVADFQYQFNDANDISAITDLNSTNSYSYDALDRLTSAIHSNQANESYTLDAAGNRVSSHLSTTYGYQPFNRLVSTASAAYSYDTNGNLISKTDPSGTTQYAWDFEACLGGLTKAGHQVNNASVAGCADRLTRNARILT